MSVPIKFVTEGVLKGDLATWGDDGIMYRKDLPAGTAKWIDDHDYLHFVCPCGCGAVGVTIIRGHGCNPDEHPSWEWDGNDEKPTLSPSIQRNTPCRWHGWLRAGEFVAA